MDAGLPPWAELSYFDNPTTQVTSLGVNSIAQICQYDASRIALILSASMGSTNQGRFLINNPGTPTEGYCFFGTNATLVLDYKHHGPLVMQAWFGISTAPSIMTAYGMRLKNWPQNVSSNVDNGQIRDAINALTKQVQALTLQQRKLYDTLQQFGAVSGTQG